MPNDYRPPRHHLTHPVYPVKAGALSAFLLMLKIVNSCRGLARLDPSSGGFTTRRGGIILYRYEAMKEDVKV
jgi:hypothetical protein